MKKLKLTDLKKVKIISTQEVKKIKGGNSSGGLTDVIVWPT